MNKTIIEKVSDHKIQKNLIKGLCPTCGKEIGKFRNDISRVEYKISGMCQNCQDEVFGKD